MSDPVTGDADRKDRLQSRQVAIALTLLVVVLGAAILLLLPALTQLVESALSPGLGLKDSAVIAFFVTIILMVIFAIASGDGLIGELQFILAGFSLFFVVIWLMLAWIF